MRSPSANSVLSKSVVAAWPYPIHAPVASASSMWPETKSAWKWVLMTPTISKPCSSASERYSSMSRRGSTTTAFLEVSSPIR